MIPARAVTLAAAAYPVESLPDLAAVAEKRARWVAEAAGQGADLLVFPEYGGMEAALAVHPGAAEAEVWCARAADLADWDRELMAGLARRYGVTLLAGSRPERAGGAFVNRAWLFDDAGGALAFDKRIPTPWERAHTPIRGGAAGPAAGTAAGRTGVLLCYDAEFPLLARGLGADLLLVPSCTDTPAGAARVEIAARARALESRALCVAAPLLGGVPRCPLVDANRGRAGIYGPPDVGMPDDGILARGATDAPGWVLARIAAGALSAARARGAVDVAGDWPLSAGGRAPADPAADAAAQQA